MTKYLMSTKYELQFGTHKSEDGRQMEFGVQKYAR
jgi:hypothetical protein